ncbi:hypothetical protein GS482_21325 [Rhodococcus hoagii]|nr:hypothetical protein [Prescottella equi]
MNANPPTWGETTVKAIVAAIPYVGNSLTAIVNDMSQRREHRASEALNAVIDAVGAPELQRRAEEDPEFDALLAEMVLAAVRSGLEEKRRVLARVVANAAASSEPIDTAQLVVAALSDLDGPHIRALARIRAAEKAALPGDVEPDSEERGSRLEDAAFEAGRKEEPPVLSALIRTGVAYPATLVGGGVAICGTTPFGQELLSYLEDEWKPLP